jgi:Phage tail tube, TTP, lambda-like
MSVKTQGTELFFADSTATTPAMVKLTCPTGISGLGGAADQIDITCLDATTDRAFTRGLGNPGQVSVPFIMKPTDASHQRLFVLKETGDTLNWMICLSDGSADPTYAAGSLTAPTGRTSIAFSAYIADVALDIATNEVVRGTLTLQRSGAVTTTWKS